MSDFNIPHQDDKPPATILDRLAASLGYPTEAFFDPRLSEEGQALEFLRLWHAIENEQDRSKVLVFLRNMSVKELVSSKPVTLAHTMQKPGRDP